MMHHLLQNAANNEVGPTNWVLAGKFGEKWLVEGSGFSVDAKHELPAAWGSDHYVFNPKQVPMLPKRSEPLAE